MGHSWGELDTRREPAKPRRWRVRAFPISKYAEGADGKPFRLEVSVHRWRLGLEVAFRPGWGLAPWQQRFDYLRLMFVWWHVVIGMEAD